MDNFTTLLEKCLELNGRIIRTDENIFILKEVAYSPRNQVINGMPRSEGGNALEKYLVKLEKYKNKRLHLKNELLTTWKKAAAIMGDNDISAEDIMMMYYRFFKGLAWKQVNNEMQKLYKHSGWNENKCFRVYRCILAKVNNI